MQQLGMIGLGRMGGNMVRRLADAGVECVIHDANAAAMSALARPGVIACTDARGLRRQAAGAARDLADAARGHRRPGTGIAAAAASPGDTIIDGGNSYYHDDIRRGDRAPGARHSLYRCRHQRRHCRFDNGYCLMSAARRRSSTGSSRSSPRWRPARIRARCPRRPNDPDHGAARLPALRPAGAGHFVKMIHNGIEYGVMAAFAEGMNILRNANVGKQTHAVDAETTPLRHPEHYQYDFDLGADRGGLAAWQRDPFVAARSHCAGAARGRESFRVRGPRFGFRRRPLDGRRRIEAGVPAPVITPRCSAGSNRAAMPTTRIGCCRRCASSSAATSRRNKATFRKGDILFLKRGQIYLFGIKRQTIYWRTARNARSHQ